MIIILVFIVVVLVVVVALYFLLWRNCPRGYVLSGGRCIPEGELLPVTPKRAYVLLGLRTEKVLLGDFTWDTFTDALYNSQTGDVSIPLTGSMLINFAFARSATSSPFQVRINILSATGSSTVYDYTLSPSASLETLSASLELPVERGGMVRFIVPVQETEINLEPSGTYASLSFSSFV
ncbi:Transmembrane domain-containing protein [Brazilian cedratvirus IHUMI]|uniref:Transmembrane domain-containing protein n=1 Tax=Brazilian cedratvirus IHUMI TaxID=2126980 RepID=A0A2R8FF49_9VIRU|nr:Transmembrane domain-containing protein [Brazilian cedratvirus IHUMI]